MMSYVIRPWECSCFVCLFLSSHLRMDGSHLVRGVDVELRYWSTPRITFSFFYFDKWWNTSLAAYLTHILSYQSIPRILFSENWNAMHLFFIFPNLHLWLSGPHRHSNVPVLYDSHCVCTVWRALCFWACCYSAVLCVYMSVFMCIKSVACLKSFCCIEIQTHAHPTQPPIPPLMAVIM